MEKVILDSQHPYIGLQSFQEEHKFFFHGRDRDISEIFHLIDNNIVTVLTGISGLGKTSLLQAGLCPELHKNYYYPIYIRFNFECFEEYKQNIENQLKEAIEVSNSEVTFDGETSLWEYFHRIKLYKNLVCPVLIFDQFEELFTIGRNHKENVNKFIDELSNLIENRIPLAFENTYKDSSIPFDIHDQNYRIVISLREDYLAYLEDLNKKIPSLKKTRFRLKYLDGKQALDAILIPGKEIIDKEEAIKIIQLLCESQSHFNQVNLNDSSDTEFQIEPFLLSFLCYRINNLRLSDNKRNNRYEKITDKFLDKVNIHGIINNFYTSSISDLRSEVKNFIENKLITNEGFRLMQPVDNTSITKDELVTLIDRRIIRKEIRNNIEYIEIIHDLLAPVIIQSREDEERKKKLEEKEKQAELRRQKEEDERKIKYENDIALQKKKTMEIRRFAAIIIVFFIISVGIAFGINYLKVEAIEAEKIANSKSEELKEANKRVKEINCELDKEKKNVDSLYSELEQRYNDLQQANYRTKQAKDTTYVLSVKLKNLEFAINNKNEEIKSKDQQILQANDSIEKVKFERQKQELIDGKDKLIKEKINNNMVLVEGGSFSMGNLNGSEPRSETNVHQEVIKSFFMDITEVTVEQYSLYCKEKGIDMPSPPPWGEWKDLADFPMVNISWEDATLFAIWARKRLPSEAEWEYAARGGSYNSQNNFIYSGDSNPNLVAWYSNNKPAKVAYKHKPNQLGIYDMSGNVSEWCQDIYSELTPYLRVTRGGGYDSNKDFITVYRRYKELESKGNFKLGFRCIKDFK